MANVVVLGAGGWGTALAIMAYRHGNAVTLWSAFPEELDSIRRHGQHKKLLPGVAVSPHIDMTDDLACVKGADLVILAVPSFAICEMAKKLADVLPAGALLVNVGKGIDAASNRLFGDLLTEMLPAVRVAVLSGPSHAEEVARAVPTSVVSAAADAATAEEVQKILMNPTFRIYANTDMVGVELGGAMKNVIALSAGIADGLDMGDNAKAALMTRGLSEIARLGVAMGARPETFAGLSGMGDLIVTCGSMHSRNRRAGILIGQGMSPAEAIQKVGTVEGYLAVAAARTLAERYGVELPISEQCYRICYENMAPKEALAALMQRPRNYETDRNWLG